MDRNLMNEFYQYYLRTYRSHNTYGILLSLPLSLLLLFLLVITLATFSGCHRRIPGTGPTGYSSSITRQKEAYEVPPSWVIHRRDTRYPHALYLMGVGVSGTESASADENARIDLLKQIEVEISGEESAFQLEASSNGDQHQQSMNQEQESRQESRVESRIRMKVNTRVSGLTISERWHDEKEKRYYSLATLDRDIASQIWEDEINNAIESINNLYSSAWAYEKDREWVSALNNYQQAYAQRNAFDALWRKYLVIKNKNQGSVTGAGSQELPAKMKTRIKPLYEIKERLDNLISGIKIFSLDGDNQKGLPGNPLARKLTVKVVFEERTGDSKRNQYPLSGMPIKFSFDSSGGELDTEVITDANGVAGSRVYVVGKSETKANTISARINLAKINLAKINPTMINPAMINLEGLEGFEGLAGMEGKKAVFTYHTPVDLSQESKEYSWSEGITRLVEEIISKTYGEGVIKVAVLDFVEARSEERVALSRILESDLRTTLAKVEDMVVIDTGEQLKGSTQDLRERARSLNADLYLSGVYWLHDQGLRVNAKLVDTKMGTLISTARVIMTSKGINSDDLKSVNLTPADLKAAELKPAEPNSAELKPAATPGATGQAAKDQGAKDLKSSPSYDLVIDKVYFSEEEDHKFNLDIWTDQKEYETGDSLTIHVKSDRDCYLSLLDIGTSGKLTVLFPNPAQRDNFIHAGKTYSIPDDFEGFSIDIQGPAGVERIKAIATLKPFSLVENEIPDSFYSLEKENIGGLNQIARSMQNLSSIPWVQDFAEIRIYQKGEDRTKKTTRSIKSVKPPDEPQVPIDIIGTPSMRKDKAREVEDPAGPKGRK